MLCFTPGPAPHHSELPSSFRSLGITVRRLLIITFVIRVVHPFSDVAGHIVQPIGAATGIERPWGSEILVTVLTAIHVGRIRHELVPPGISSLALATAGLLPFCFRRQALASPLAIGQCLIPGHAHDGELRL